MRDEHYTAVSEPAAASAADLSSGRKTDVWRTDLRRPVDDEESRERDAILWRCIDVCLFTLQCDDVVTRERDGERASWPSPRAIGETAR